VCASCLPFCVGLITLVKGPDWLLDCSVARTSHAIFLAFSASQCCFQSHFVVQPFSWACAWIIPAIHVSHLSGLAFSWLNHLYALQIMSCMACGSRLKLVVCCSMPAFLARDLTMELPMAQPCLQGDLWAPWYGACMKLPAFCFHVPFVFCSCFVDGFIFLLLGFRQADLHF